MSLGEDIKVESYIDYLTWLNDIKVSAQSKIWTTKTGSRIPVSRMSSRHIINTVKLLRSKNQNDEFEPWITVFKQELSSRGIGI